MPLPVNTHRDIAEQDIHQRIRILSNDRFEGRGPGSGAGEQTADWLAAEFARLGLQPGGEGGTWFQIVDMIEQTLDPTSSALTFVGPEHSTELQLGRDAVMWTKHQDVDDLSFAKSDLVFVGYGIIAPEYGWNDYAGVDVTGKTVLMLINDPGYARGGSLFKGDEFDDHTPGGEQPAPKRGADKAAAR